MPSTDEESVAVSPNPAGDSTRPLVIHTRVISGKGGGPEKTILNSPRFLNRSGCRGYCLYFRDATDAGFDVVRSRAEQWDAPLIAVDDQGVFDWKILGRTASVLSKVLAESNGDTGRRPWIWHGHDYKSNLIGLLLRRRFPEMRLVTTVHGWVHRTWKTPLYYAIDKWCLKRYEKVICVSRDLFEGCRKLGVGEERLSLIDNAIALDDYELDRSPSEARGDLGIDPSGKLVVGVGRLSDEKGFDLLIDAVARLIAEGHSVNLAIAGEGVMREKLEQQIKRLAVEQQVRLLGFVSDPRLVYRAADVFVLSSFREGLPNVVLEAMAMRRPVVSTKIAGMPDLVVDNLNGFMIPAGDTAAIQDALRRLLDDDSLRDRLGDAGRKTVESRFSFAIRMEKIAAIYDDVLNTSRQ